MSKAEIKLSFGVNAANRIVHINDVERGRACDCTCPGCGAPLLAAKGPVQQHHFKHAVELDCEGAAESAIHRAACGIRRGSHPAPPACRGCARRARKTAIFERRTLERYKPVAHVETAAEALAVSLNEAGEIHWPRMEQVTGRPARALQRELGSLVYCNPEGGQWETADRYLSGDVRRKLAVATAAAGLDPAYERNIEALKAVQPVDLEPGDIEARLGSSWIPASDIRDFVAGLLDTAPRNVRVAHAPAIATWTVEIDGGEKFSVGNTTTFGSARFRASELIEQALNGRVPTAYDQQPDGSRIINQQETVAAREKQQQLKDRFREWVRSRSRTSSATSTASRRWSSPPAARRKTSKV
jgi:N12 class adenine-specific DNA methylase